jgi:hypothetical protein
LNRRRKWLFRVLHLSNRLKPTVSFSALVD